MIKKERKYVDGYIRVNKRIYRVIKIGDEIRAVEITGPTRAEVLNIAYNIYS